MQRGCKYLIVVEWGLEKSCDGNQRMFPTQCEVGGYQGCPTGIADLSLRTLTDTVSESQRSSPFTLYRRISTMNKRHGIRWGAVRRTVNDIY